jgi:hypothetical protein
LHWVSANTFIGEKMLKKKMSSLPLHSLSKRGKQA